jgi:hypothetical protein
VSPVASIADVFVTVVPETSRIAKGIEDALRRVDARKIGRELGRELQQGMKDVKVDVRADTAKAKGELDRLAREKRTTTIQARVDKTSLSKVSRDIQAATAPIARVGPVAIAAPNIVRAGAGGDLPYPVGCAEFHCRACYFETTAAAPPSVPPGKIVGPGAIRH